jgi:two-component system, LytTR family, sensor histidine kinase AgrC
MGLKKLEKDNVIKGYYKIILILVLQMMLLTVFVTNSFMKNHVYVFSKMNGQIEMVLGLIMFSFSFNSIFVVKKLYLTAKENHLYCVNKLKFGHIEEQSRIHQRHKHDLLNHLNILGVLAHEEKWSDLKRYLSDYITDINNVPISIDTGLKEMDILLYSKINNARKMGIHTTFKCTALISCKKNRNIINLISIFSNLLDNAIEASALTKEKSLSIFISEDPLDYSFIIENSCSIDTTLKEAIQKGISTKGVGRGQGLNIVKSLVKKLEGNLNPHFANDRLNFQLELPKHNL